MRVDRGVPRMAVAGVALAAGMAFAAAAWAQGEWKAPAHRQTSRPWYAVAPLAAWIRSWPTLPLTTFPLLPSL